MLKTYCYGATTSDMQGLQLLPTASLNCHSCVAFTSVPENYIYVCNNDAEYQLFSQHVLTSQRIVSNEYQQQW
jgi:hypothetical protein